MVFLLYLFVIMRSLFGIIGSLFTSNAEVIYESTIIPAIESEEKKT